MYELIQVGEKTYYVNSLARMGLYKLSDTDVCLIDTGNDKDAGKKLLKHIDANGWKLKLIINTHFHADHTGGNALLQQRTGCRILAPGIDGAFVNYPILEPAQMFGGYPCKELRGKFLMAQPSAAEELTEETLPLGLTMLPLEGHTFSMTAIKTDDDIWFLGDCLTSAAIIAKYHISVLYDVGGYLNSLNAVKSLTGKLFIPAHAEPVTDITELAEVNERKVYEIISMLKDICSTPKAFDDVLKAVFDRYALTMDFTQNVLVGGTLRSYLSYLHDAGEMDVIIKDNILMWSTP